MSSQGESRANPRFSSLEESKFGSLMERDDEHRSNFSYYLAENGRMDGGLYRSYAVVTLRSFVCKAFGFDPALREEVLVAGLKNKFERLHRQKRILQRELENMDELLKNLREREQKEKLRVVKAMRVFEEQIEGFSSQTRELTWRSEKKRLTLEEILKTIKTKLLANTSCKSSSNKSEDGFAKSRWNERGVFGSKVQSPQVKSEWLNSSTGTFRTNGSFRQSNFSLNKKMKMSHFSQSDFKRSFKCKLPNYKKKIQNNLKKKINLREKILNGTGPGSNKRSMLRRSLQKVIKTNPFAKKKRLNIDVNSQVDHSNLVRSLFVNSRKSKFYLIFIILYIFHVVVIRKQIFKKKFKNFWSQISK